MGDLIAIGELSKLIGISIRTIRYYEEVGIFEPTETTDAGYRFYSQDKIQKLEQILLLKNIGMTLKEINQALNVQDKDTFLEILRDKEKDIENKVIKLLNTQNALRSFIEYLSCDEISKISLSNLLQSDVIKGECLEMNEIVMEVKVFDLEKDIKTVGVSTKTPLLPIEEQNVLEEFYEKYWQEDIRSKIPNRKVPAVQYGICTEYKGDSFTYIIAEEVINYQDVPDGFRSFTIPAGLYAVITFKAQSFDELINSALAKAVDYITKTWLPESDYEYGGNISFEVYDERSRRREKPEMDFYIPIKKSKIK